MRSHTPPLWEPVRLRNLYYPSAYPRLYDRDNLLSPWSLTNTTMFLQLVSLPQPYVRQLGLIVRPAPFTSRSGSLGSLLLYESAYSALTVQPRSILSRELVTHVSRDLTGAVGGG